MLYPTDSKLEIDPSQLRVYITTTPLELYKGDDTFYDFGQFPANGFMFRVYMTITDPIVFVFPSRIKTSGYRNRYLETDTVGSIVRAWLASWPHQDSI